MPLSRANTQSFLRQPHSPQSDRGRVKKNLSTWSLFISLGHKRRKRWEQKVPVWLFNELRIDRNSFDVLVNAVSDMPLQRRGRRAFVFAHRERILFLHTFLAFGLHVAHMLLLPRIKSSSEVNAIAKRIIPMKPCNLCRDCPLSSVARSVARPEFLNRK